MSGVRKANLDFMKKNCSQKFCSLLYAEPITMRLQRIALTGLTTLLGTTIALPLSSLPALPLSASQLLSQTSSEPEAEADRLLQLGSQQYQQRQFADALLSLQKALAIYQQRGNRQGEAGSLFLLGLIHNSQQKYQQAIEFFQKSLAIAREVNNPWLEAKALFGLGLTYSSLGEYQQAINNYQQAITIQRDIKDKQGVADSLLGFGLAYIKQGNYPQAIQFLDQALAIKREIKDYQGEANSLLGLGEAYLKQNQYQKAINCYQKSLTIIRSIGNRFAEGTALNNLAEVYRNLGQYQQAIELFQQSLTIRQQLSDRSGEAASLNNLSLVYLSSGQYQRAIDYNQRNLLFAREIGDNKLEGVALNNLGEAYRNLGQYQQAIEFYQQSLAIAKKLGDLLEEAKILNNLGLTYGGRREYKLAIDYFQQSLVITQKMGEKAVQGTSLNNLGLVYSNLGQNQQAIKFYQQSLAVAKQLGNLAEEAKVLNNLGLIYGGRGEYKSAIDYFQQSLAITQKIEDKPTQGTSLINIGSALFLSGQIVKSEKILRDAIEIWESIRSDLGSNDANKVSYMDLQLGSYRLLQEILITQNKPIDALEISERGRARAFVELLAKQLSTESNVTKIDYPSVQKIQQIAKQQNATLVEYSIIYQYGSQDKIKYQESYLYIWVVKPTGEITFREVDLKSLLQKQKTSLAELVPSVRDAINVRGSTTNKITYVPGQYVKFNSDLKHWQPWEIISVNIEKRTLTVRQPTYQPGVTDERSFDEVQKIDQTSLQELYQILIQPIADLLPTNPNERVIFIPQGSLFLVPFAALQDPQGKYLIENHTILTAPSIQVLDLTRKQRERLTGTAKNALVVGNPSPMPQPFQPLEYAESEAVDIAQQLGTKAIIGKDATESAIVAKMPNARIIHLATHGQFEDTRGLGSSIALAPAGKDDGLLKAEEILNLKLNAELVILSACDTGRGRLTGDGVIGLSRSLISAGVSSVIVSLWKVPDKTTAGLMPEFYRQLQRNPDKAQALRQAMLVTMKKHPNPGDWAGFTLIGEAE
jgi:CHAT domain-containing protein/Tfp pilus assembly protein PilF